MAVKKSTTKRNSVTPLAAGVKSAKATNKKSIVKKAAAAPTASKTTAITEKLKKSDIYAMIAEGTGLSKKQVSSVLQELSLLVERSIKKRGVGEFTIPGLCKIKVVKKLATKARKGISPFTGEETIYKAKPARNVVKLRALKSLKTMAE